MYGEVLAWLVPLIVTVLIAHAVVIIGIPMLCGYRRVDFPRFVLWVLGHTFGLTLFLCLFLLPILYLANWELWSVIILIGILIGLVICPHLVKALQEQGEDTGRRLRENKERRIERDRKMIEFRATLKQWQVEGYSELKGLMAVKNFDQMERKFNEAEQKIERLKAVESTLNRLFQDAPEEQAVFESEMESTRKKQKDLSKVDEVESEIKNLKNELNRYYQLKNEILDSITKVTYE